MLEHTSTSFNFRNVAQAPPRSWADGKPLQSHLEVDRDSGHHHDVGRRRPALVGDGAQVGIRERRKIEALLLVGFGEACAFDQVAKQVLGRPRESFRLYVTLSSWLNA